MVVWPPPQVDVKKIERYVAFRTFQQQERTHTTWHQGQLLFVSFAFASVVASSLLTILNR